MIPEIVDLLLGEESGGLLDGHRFTADKHLKIHSFANLMKSTVDTVHFLPWFKGKLNSLDKPQKSSLLSGPATKRGGG